MQPVFRSGSKFAKQTHPAAVLSRSSGFWERLCAMHRELQGENPGSCAKLCNLSDDHKFTDSMLSKLFFLYYVEEIIKLRQGFSV